MLFKTIMIQLRQNFNLKFKVFGRWPTQPPNHPSRLPSRKNPVCHTINSENNYILFDQMKCSPFGTENVN